MGYHGAVRLAGPARLGWAGDGGGKDRAPDACVHATAAVSLAVRP
jgi:hypothetical protein